MGFMFAHQVVFCPLFGFRYGLFPCPRKVVSWNIHHFQGHFVESGRDGAFLRYRAFLTFLKCGVFKRLGQLAFVFDEMVFPVHIQELRQDGDKSNQNSVKLQAPLQAACRGAGDSGAIRTLDTRLRRGQSTLWIYTNVLRVGS